MKKSHTKYLLMLLMLLLPSVQPVAYAYYYLTVYCSDGTRWGPFYTTDVDRICCSKTDISGVEKEQYVTQEIWMGDSVCRIPIADVDSIAFTEVDVDVTARYILGVVRQLDVLTASDGALDAEASLQVLGKLEGVEDVYFSGSDLFVKIKDWGCVSYLNTPPDVMASEPGRAPYRIAPRLAPSAFQHEHYDYRKACIVNQMYKDDRRAIRAERMKYLKQSFENVGISCDIINNPTANFFGCDTFGFSGEMSPEHFQYLKMYDYDIVFLNTHGTYDKKQRLHWLLTSNECLNSDDDIDFDKACKELGDDLERMSPRMFGVGVVKERRAGHITRVCYVSISQEAIKASSRSFASDGKAIVFNTACQSLKGDMELGNAFIGRGASCYLGFDDNDRIGCESGMEFFYRLLNGRSVYDAFQTLPERLRSEHYYFDKESNCYDTKPAGIEVTEHSPHLHLLKKTSGNGYCVVAPHTGGVTEIYDGEYTVKISGEMRMDNPNDSRRTEGLSVYFLVSENADMSDSEEYRFMEDGLDDISFNPDTHTLTISHTFRVDDLEPLSTYYYCLVFQDEHGTCRGDVRMFTLEEEEEEGEEDGPEAYVAEEILNGTLTFYYDTLQYYRWKEENVITYSLEELRSRSHREENRFVKSVTFDKSFANYRPTRTDLWFYMCEQLTTINGLSYLNTSEVTDMSCMFLGCKSLKILDLSTFDTHKVTDMGGMFQGCQSLEEVDISSFNTSLVTQMGGLFSRCESLRSIDVSHFNTSKVNDFSHFFYHCKSLRSLDLSCFQTSQATKWDEFIGGCISLQELNLSNINLSAYDKIPSLFCDCKALVSLDLSDAVLYEWSHDLFANLEHLVSVNLTNINTSEVTSMSRMFSGCSSLTSVDMSSFDTKNVTTMWEMFSGCSSLESVNFGFINTRNVETMEKMFYGCSSLLSIDLSRFNLSSVETMEHMFDGCVSLTTADLRCLGTTKDEYMGYVYMNYMFSGCSSLTSVSMSCDNPSAKLLMNNMFERCTSLTSIDMSNFTASVLAMSQMFIDCISLSSVNMNSITASDIDMGEMFSRCISLKSVDLSNMQVAGDEFASFTQMFIGCLSLTSVNLSNIKARGVLMDQMFLLCQSLRSVDLSQIQASCSSMLGAFCFCTSLTSVKLCSFDISKWVDLRCLFMGCTSLKSFDLSCLNPSGDYLTEDMFLDCSSLKTVYAPPTFHVEQGIHEASGMFGGCDNLTGGMGTHIGENVYYNMKGERCTYYCGSDGEYVRIDRGVEEPGLLTAK